MAKRRPNLLRFIEPLEATALLFIQRTVTAFIEFLEAGDVGPAAQERYNQRINDHFEGTRDYIVTHYKTNSRKDTEYWRACSDNGNLSDSLKQLYLTESAAEQEKTRARDYRSWDLTARQLNDTRRKFPAAG